MHTKFLVFGSSHIAYRYGGRGSRLLLCFHGYGEDAASFDFLEETLGGEFTILSIDFPHHGQTQWKEAVPLGTDDFLAIILQITEGWPASLLPWWILGYSMGGRVALSLTGKIPGKVGGVLLIAPDGLVVNPWYWLATQTGPGNLLFRLTMQHPGWFFFFLKAANALKLVNPSVYKFTRHYIGDRDARLQLYLRWTAMRRFRPDLAALQQLIPGRQIHIRLLFGRYDRIIRWERGRQFLDGILAGAPLVQMEILPQGHQLLHPRNRETITRMLTD
jgi:pimeloyl-ACP methyl ester carboxylesterase